MRSLDTADGPPLAYAAEIIFELAILRQECCQIAEELTSEGRQVDEVALEECAVLEESIAEAHQILHTTLKQIRASRERRTGGQSAG